MSGDYGGGSQTFPPAGWYPDPSNPDQQRWWTGAEWTEHVSVPAPPAPPAPPAYSQLAPPAEAPSTEQPLFADARVAADASDYTPMGPTSDYRFATVGYGTVEYVTPIPPAAGRTVAIWLLALLPLPICIAELFSISRYPAIDYFWSLTAILLIYIVPILLALWDFFALRARGVRGANPAWILLTTLTFFILRIVTLRKSGIRSAAPLVVGIICSAVCGTTVSVAAYSTAVHLFQLGTITRVKQQLSGELARETNMTWDVLCPSDSPATTVGAQFTCSATSHSGVTVNIFVTRQVDGTFHYTADTNSTAPTS